MATETVTVLFTDLVGSTELLSRVGERAAEELRREHFGLLRAAVEPHGGREVKNLGDGLMVVFASAVDAVAAAVEIQRSFELRNRAAAEALLLRVGVSLGDADVDDGDYFGVPVVEAARLCARAAGGEILIGEMVRMLARSRSGVELEPMGALELKGLDEPVETFRAVWSPVVADDVRPPLPARLASAVAPNFVGRTAERELLESAWKAVGSDGARRVMLLAGEPGIGKTALSARFAEHVYDGGGVVVYGRSDEDLGIPYQPWIELLGQLVAVAPEAVLTEHVAERGGHLARLVPELARRIPIELAPAEDGDTERVLLFGCVIDVLERLSATTPILLVLDDLHWVDRPSVQLLRQVVMSDRLLRVGILGTFRDSEVGVDHPIADLLAALHRQGGTDRINLRGLSDLDVLDLLERNAGHEMAEEGLALRDAVLAETNGNPFFVGEILRHLAESGAIYQDDAGRWVGDVDVRAVGLPVSVKEVIGRRIAGLGAETERVLSLAAVIGRDFDLTLLAAVAQLDEDAVIDLCDAAVAGAVLQTTDAIDRYTFAHALIEHTLYDRLSPARRARAHRVVAEQLETIAGAEPGARAGELAYHWSAAVQPTDLAKAIHYTKVAGDRALEQLAPDEAMRWYAQTLDMLDRAGEGDTRQRVEVLIGLGDAESLCGVAGHRERLLEAARLAIGLDDQALLEAAVFVNSRGWGSDVGGIDEERVAMLRAAIAGNPDPADARRAQLLALLASELFWAVADPQERFVLADEAVTTARRSGDPQALGRALYSGAIASRGPHTLAQRCADLDEAIQLVDEGQWLRLAWEVHTQRALAALESADAPMFWQCRSGSDAMLGKVPHALGQWSEMFHHATEQVLRGDLPAAEVLAEQALQIGIELGQPDAFDIYGAQLTNIRLHQGRWDEIIPLIESALIERPALVVYRPVLAWSHARHGDGAVADAWLDELAADGPGALPVDNAWATGMAAWTETAHLRQRRDVVDMLHGALVPFANQIVTTSITVQPAVAHYLGRLDHLAQRYDDAETWFAQALRIAESMESPLLVAYTHSAWAELAVDQGEATRARELAEAAHAPAMEGGYGYIERDARAVLDRLG